MFCIIAFVGGIVITLFVNGVFPLKEMFEGMWNNKTLVTAIVLGLLGIVSIFEKWSAVTAACIVLPCGMVVLTKFLAKDEVNTRITDAQFWIEVKLQELINIMNDVSEDMPDKAMIVELIRRKASDMSELSEDDIKNAKWEGGKLKIEKKKSSK
jgi:hypothetical protein